MHPVHGVFLAIVFGACFGMLIFEFRELIEAIANRIRKKL